MKIGETLDVDNRAAWRAWLKKHHAVKNEIWLVYHKKQSGRRRIPYNDAVEEALCYGWIDSILKPIDKNAFAQRFSPRKPKSQLSAMNIERIRRLIAGKKMTAAGLAAVRHVFGMSPSSMRVVIPADIRTALKQDRQTWNNFQAFPDSYKRIRIGWIVGARKRQAIFEQRLNYFVRMTAKNKKFGMVQ